MVPPWPKSVTWYNKDGRVDTDERYKLIEDGLGVYMIEIKPSESCDAGDWKCVVTSFEGCVGISACVVNMDSASSIPRKKKPTITNYFYLQFPEIIASPDLWRACALC